MADAASTTQSVAYGAVAGAPALILRLESAAIFIGAILTYAQFYGDWLFFLALLLTPDLSIAAYLAGPRIGARIYNAAHSYVAPIGLCGLALVVDQPALWSIAIIWTAHIGLDRMCGYGLKYPTAFRHTHLASAKQGLRKELTLAGQPEAG